MIDKTIEETMIEIICNNENVNNDIKLFLILELLDRRSMDINTAKSLLFKYGLFKRKPEEFEDKLLEEIIQQIKNCKLENQ